MNWGGNLTMVGAVRRRGWVTLSTKWRAMTKVRFIEWVRRGLAPRLRRGDVVLLDNLAAHKAAEVRVFIEQRGAMLRYLPPYSHDFNPIEPVWALVKKRIRAQAPRTGAPFAVSPAPRATSSRPITVVSTLPMLGTATQVLSEISLEQSSPELLHSRKTPVRLDWARCGRHG